MVSHSVVVVVVVLAEPTDAVGFIRSDGDGYAAVDAGGGGGGGGNTNSIDRPPHARRGS